MIMPNYREHGLTALLSDDNYFRFCECETYRKLSGNYLREMDFGWWDINTDYLYLMEFTDYSTLTTEERLPDHLLSEIVTKTVSCLLMLSSIWSNSTTGHNLRTEMNNTCPHISKDLFHVKVFFVIKIERNKELISPLLTRLRKMLKSKAALFDLDVKDDVHFLTHESAKRMGLPVDYLSL
jgi:hypothetical protein